MNDALHSRLENYKFGSAVSYLTNEDDKTMELVHCLAKMFGNCGWIPGEISVIIDNALENIGVNRRDQ